MTPAEVTETVMMNEERVVPKLIGEQQKDAWYLEAGASKHMSGCKELFADLDDGVKGTVRFDDGSLVDIQGRGKVILQCKTGEHRVLTSVSYIPRLRSNLISIG